MAGPSLVSL